MSLATLHSGCKLRDSQKTTEINRHLQVAHTDRPYGTDSTSAEIETLESNTLNAGAQLSHVTLNVENAAAGDFFFNSAL
jgi:hypothetical protein